MDNNYVLTQEGKEKLEQELHFLETEKRAEIGDRIRVAREFGDISENSEYDDAKNEQAANEARIAEITRILGEATIVEAPTESGRVNIGSRVTVDMGGREKSCFGDPSHIRILRWHNGPWHLPCRNDSCRHYPVSRGHIRPES